MMYAVSKALRFKFHCLGVPEADAVYCIVDAVCDCIGVWYQYRYDMYGRITKMTYAVSKALRFKFRGLGVPEVDAVYSMFHT